jgi:hypothetical protein
MVFNNSFYNERLPTYLKRLHFGSYQYGQTLNWDLPVRTDLISPIIFLTWALHYAILPESGE